MSDGPRAGGRATSAWDDFLDPEPPPPAVQGPARRRGPFHPGPLGLLVWIVLAAAAGGAGGIAWHAGNEEVVTVRDDALSTLAPGIVGEEAEAWAMTQVVGLMRADGVTLDEWVEGIVDDQRCPPDQPRSTWTWLVLADGTPDQASWRVGVRRVSHPDATCTAAWDRFWLGQVAAADGVVREITCTSDLVPACPGRQPDGPLPDEPVNAVVDWLDEFRDGVS